MTAAEPSTCKRGHEWTEENTRITPKGGRVCRACNRENVQRYYKRVGTTNPFRKKKEPPPG